jgi:nucleoside-diphosphate-sugar epimerase
MAGCIAAITTLGGRTGESPANNRIDYTGNNNVVEQAEKLGVERLILVTSIGCGATKKAVSPTAYSVLEKAITEKNKVEKILQLKTKMDWTIIRPGGLKNDVGTGKGILTTDVMASGKIDIFSLMDVS